jgi:hypothetical protein
MSKSDQIRMLSRFHSSCLGLGNISGSGVGHYPEIGSGHKAQCNPLLLLGYDQSLVWGLLPGVFAALLSVVVLDYYFLPRLYALGEARV